MTRIAFLLVAVVAVVGVVASMAPASGHADEKAVAIFVTNIPPGYRDWRLVSVAHEEGNLNDIRAILGNDTAITAYREGKLPFPEGTIIARIAWSYVASEENNKIFGRAQSFVPGPPPDWYLQFMVKDSKKYAATGGWGSFNSIRTANLPTTRDSKPAFPATSRSKLATSSSPVTHLNAQNYSGKEWDDDRTQINCSTNQAIQNCSKGGHHDPSSLYTARQQADG
jgi:Cytochrome P460